MYTYIKFNVKEAYDFLLINGYVYSFRAKRKTGSNIPVYHDGTKVAYATVEDVCSVTRSTIIGEASKRVRESGFKSVLDWLKHVPIKNEHRMHLYKVTLTNVRVKLLQRSIYMVA